MRRTIMASLFLSFLLFAIIYYYSLLFFPIVYYCFAFVDEENNNGGSSFIRLDKRDTDGCLADVKEYAPGKE